MSLKYVFNSFILILYENIHMTCLQGFFKEYDYFEFLCNMYLRYPLRSSESSGAEN